MHRSWLLFAFAIGTVMSALPAHADCCAVVELRQYTLKPGQRDALIDLFERHFIEPQEAAGMALVGQFRDRRREDRFVWIRGFADMPSRHKALETFYGGPVWAAYRNAANDTMLDTDDVLLLKPARPELAFRLDAASGGTRGGDSRKTTVLAGVYQLPQTVGAQTVSQFERQVAPVIRAAGIALEGVFITEPSPNTFTRLPVRENEHVLVWFGTVATDRASRSFLDRLANQIALDDRRATLLELEPTSRSRFGNGPNAARDAKHDFEFLQGSWRVHHRRLDPATQQWVEFEGVCTNRPLMDGAANMEEHTLRAPTGTYRAVALRAFDAGTNQWAIWWLDGRHPSGPLDPPVTGRFENGVGSFYADYIQDGNAMRGRFLWSNVTPTSARWEQSASADGGKTWAANWIMTFERVAPNDQPIAEAVDASKDSDSALAANRKECRPCHE